MLRSCHPEFEIQRDKILHKTTNLKYDQNSIIISPKLDDINLIYIRVHITFQPNFH